MTTDKTTLRGLLKEKFPKDHGQLLPVLHFLQHEFGHLPEWAMEIVGWHLGIPASEVYGAATSYTELKIDKPGENTLRVCTGLSCWINGSSDLVNVVKAALQIHTGNTTPDGLITYEETSCGFLCAMAPAVEWNSQWTGRVTVESMKDLIKEAQA